jgi:thioredoxin-like negative regulator of GroEL
VLAHELKYAAAEEKLRWTVAAEPEDPKNAHVLAVFLWAKGRDEEALETIDEATWRARPYPLLRDLRAEITGEAATGS